MGLEVKSQGSSSGALGSLTETQSPDLDPGLRNQGDTSPPRPNSSSRLCVSWFSFLVDFSLIFAGSAVNPTSLHLPVIHSSFPVLISLRHRFDLLNKEP